LAIKFAWNLNQHRGDMVGAAMKRGENNGYNHAFGVYLLNKR
jgi:hypothetical protein